MLLREWVELGHVKCFSLCVIVDGLTISILNGVHPHTIRYDEKADHVHVGQMFASGRLEATRVGDEYWVDSQSQGQQAEFWLGPVRLVVWRKWLREDEAPPSHSE